MDKKHRKKLKRTAKKKKDRAIAQEAQKLQGRLKKQINMFDRMPSGCSACEKEFPKTREAHMSWRVVVRNDKEQVRLFCPDCQEKAKNMMENSDEI